MTWTAVAWISLWWGSITGWYITTWDQPVGACQQDVQEVYTVLYQKKNKSFKFVKTDCNMAVNNYYKKKLSELN